MQLHKKFGHLDCCKLRAGFLTLYGYFAPCPKHLHSMMMIGERDSLFTQKFSPCFPTLFRIDIINKMRGAPASSKIALFTSRDSGMAMVLATEFTLGCSKPQQFQRCFLDSKVRALFCREPLQSQQSTASIIEYLY